MSDREQRPQTAPGACKCGASTYEDHQDKVKNKLATAHVYRGFFWRAGNDG